MCDRKRLEDNMQFDEPKDGNELYQWAKDLFPICRSLTGPGVRETLQYIKKIIPQMMIKEVLSGVKAFDWTIPDEWVINDAYVMSENGQKIIDFQVNNLHLVGYSEPKDDWVSAEELKEHLHSLPEYPDAIPYVTSYYKKTWGFCLSENERKKIKPGRYKVYIDSKLLKGKMNYGELLIKGKSKEEILISTYICHPSMANNELSGPIITNSLARWLTRKPPLRYSYRILFLPETIGSIYYLSINHEHMKKWTKAGFVMTCMGDENEFSLMPTKYENTYIDKLAKHVLKHISPNYINYHFKDRGSDERQYSSPGIDIPVISVMRSKYGEYPQYHTSMDNLDFISPVGLYSSYEVMKIIIDALENDSHPVAKHMCEPQMGKRNLYSSLGLRSNREYTNTRKLMDILAYADGQNDLIDIANRINDPIWSLYEPLKILQKWKLLV